MATDTVALVITGELMQEKIKVKNKNENTKQIIEKGLRV